MGIVFRTQDVWLLESGQGDCCRVPTRMSRPLCVRVCDEGHG